MGSESGTESQPVPRRAGSVWSPEDSAALRDGLRTGATLEGLAVTLQRRVSAISARCKKMLPAHLQATVLRAEADLHLRDLLAADPDFDAEANLDRNTTRTWNPDRDALVVDGWKTRRPLPDLAETVATSEIATATRLIQLGLAADSLAVAERLGCTPGGALDLRCRMMRDRAAASVWVLVADGLPEEGHVSLHPTRGDAHHHLTAITPADAAGGTIEATVAERAVGSPHGPVHPLHPADHDAQQ